MKKIVFIITLILSSFVIQAQDLIPPEIIIGTWSVSEPIAFETAEMNGQLVDNSDFDITKFEDEPINLNTEADLSFSDSGTFSVDSKKRKWNYLINSTTLKIGESTYNLQIHSDKEITLSRHYTDYFMTSWTLKKK